MTTSIKLFTTSGCHLCEQAASMVSYLLANNPQMAKKFQLKEVEIANDDELLEQYGVRIPVLLVENQELGWPFDFQELTDWLN